MDNRITVRPAEASDAVATWLERSWGDTAIAVHGTLYDAAALPALVALHKSAVVGVLTYAACEEGLEIVTCSADPPGRGAGRALVRAAIDVAEERNLPCVWCTTTNDNLPALGFWQAVGFSLTTLRPGAVAAARELKPGIPLRGYRGLPLRDELDLCRKLRQR